MTSNSTRCSTTTKECETYDDFVLPDICMLSHLKVIGGLAMFDPAISSCPVKKVIKFKEFEQYQN
jgi:hypothetical protein